MVPPTSPPTLWVDGRLVPYDHATVHVLSHAVQRGTTVFDVLPVVWIDREPHALGLEAHVVRFGNSMNLMGMDPAHNSDDLSAAVSEVVRANDGCSSIKLTALWAEPSHDAMPATFRPQIVVAPSRPSPSPATISVQTAPNPKMPAEVLPPELKAAAAYTPGIRAMIAAKAAGFDQVILRTQGGELAESVTSSVFVGGSDGLAVPPLGQVLDSVTRRMVLDIAEAEGVPLTVRPVSWDEVTGATEMFWTSSNHPVWPVHRLDDRSIDAPGPHTAVLAAAADELLAGRHDLSARWLTAL